MGTPNPVARCTTKSAVGFVREWPPSIPEGLLQLAEAQCGCATAEYFGGSCGRRPQTVSSRRAGI